MRYLSLPLYWLTSRTTEHKQSPPVRHHLLCRQAISHGDTPPLDVRAPLTGGGVWAALLAVREGEGGLQVSQG